MSLFGNKTVATILAKYTKLHQELVNHIDNMLAEGDKHSAKADEYAAKASEAQAEVTLAKHHAAKVKEAFGL